MYPENIVKPMRDEMTVAGFSELKSTHDVENVISKKGTTLVFINSICGCAAGSARPGVVRSLNLEKKPDQLATVFAGVDHEATQKAREFMIPFPPSSPSIALFKDGELVHMIERHQIEGKAPNMIASDLTNAYQQFC